MTRYNRQLLLKKIGRAEFTTRTLGLLNREGIGSVGDIALRSGDELRNIVGFGAESWKEVQALIVPFGIDLRHPDVQAKDRIRELYGAEVPISCISYPEAGHVTNAVTNRLEECGVGTLQDGINITYAELTARLADGAGFGSGMVQDIKHNVRQLALLLG